MNERDQPPQDRKRWILRFAILLFLIGMIAVSAYRPTPALSSRSKFYETLIVAKLTILFILFGVTWPHLRDYPLSELANSWRGRLALAAIGVGAVFALAVVLSLFIR